MGFTFSDDLFQQIPIGLIVVCLENPNDPHSLRISDLNLTAAAIIGVSVERLRGKALGDFPGVFTSSLQDQLTQIIRTKGPRELGQVEHGDSWIGRGAYRLQTFALADNCLGLVFESSAQHLQTGRAVPDAIFSLDPKGRIYIWNLGAERIMGYSTKEIMGNHLSVFYTPEDIRANKPEQLLEQARRDGQAHDEGWRVRKDGSRFWASVLLTAVHDERRELRRFTNITLDMTERHEREEALRRSKQTLELQVEGRTAQLLKVNAEFREEIHKHMETEARLTESLGHLRDLAARLQSVREEERAHVAREIHDELGQSCTALKMDLSAIVRRLPQGQKYSLAKARSSMQLVDGMIRTIRQIASELRPSTLDALGLPAAMEWQAHEFQTRTGIACDLELPGETLDLDAERSTAVFRIFQETLTNVTRHAEATRVDVRLVKTNAELLLEIRDNGKGFDTKQVLPRQSLGLLGMRERALVLGGVFTVNSRPGEGTTVTMRIPVGLPYPPGSNP